MTDFKRLEEEAREHQRTGGQAFPLGAASFGPSGDMAFPEDGMTLRDWFAGQAMAGLLANPQIDLGNEFALDQIVLKSFDYADAMLKVREP